MNRASTGARCKCSRVRPVSIFLAFTIRLNRQEITTPMGILYAVGYRPCVGCRIHGYLNHGVCRPMYSAPAALEWEWIFLCQWEIPNQQRGKQRRVYFLFVDKHRCALQNGPSSKNMVPDKVR